MSLHKQEDIATLNARHTGSNIFLNWKWINDTIPQYVKRTLVFYIHEGDANVIVLHRYDNSSNTEYTMTNVPPGANYNFCIRAIMSTSWTGIKDPKICTQVTNSRWEMSAFVGSVAGALLALILIVLLVLMSKSVKKRQKSNKTNLKENSQRQRYDSAFESQFDSVAIRDDTSFYDDLVTSELSYLDSSVRLSGENSQSSGTMGTMPPTVSIVDNPPIKTTKKRTSLIEEETNNGNQPCDGWMYTVAVRVDDKAYQQITDSSHIRQSPARQGRQPIIMETCIDDIEACDIPSNDEDQSAKSTQKSIISAPKLVTDCVENL